MLSFYTISPCLSLCLTLYCLSVYPAGLVPLCRYFSVSPCLSPVYDRASVSLYCLCIRSMSPCPSLPHVQRIHVSAGIRLCLPLSLPMCPGRRVSQGDTHQPCQCDIIAIRQAGGDIISPINTEEYLSWRVTLY